jgi:hypothetical protein
MSLLSPESRYALIRKLVALAIIAFGLLAFALKAWSCFCLFPIHAWNDVRLRTSFLIADGLPLYPGLNQGSITTWIYGPAHPLFFLPVTFFREVPSVYLAAGALNIIQFVCALGFTCLFWPGPRRVRQSILALLACLLLIPDVFLTIIQSDNTCLVFGLISLTCLARNTVRPSAATLWGAAFFGVSAAFAKLHGSTVIAGELLWLALFFGPKRAAKLLVRMLVCAMGWVIVTLLLAASPAAVWEHVILLPSNLPWATHLSSKLATLAPALLLMVLLPAVMIAASYRLKRVSRVAWLPIIVWLGSLPLGVLGALKIGGSFNSLHGVFYLLPFFFIEIGAGLNAPRAQIVRTLVVVCLVGLGLFPLAAATRYVPRAPFLLQVNQAEQMAISRPDSVWMPWRPLITYLAAGKNYHDEDGLYIRQLTGLYPSRKHAYSGLPARWSMTAIEVPGMEWGIARVMQPEERDPQIRGYWHIYTFPPESEK